MQDPWKFDEVIKRAEAMKRDIPKIIAKKAENYFINAFRKAAWDKQPWKEPQRKISGTKANRYAKPPTQAAKPILVNTGKLRNAVKNSLISADWSRILFRVELPYAQPNNEGFDGVQNVPAHTSHRFQKTKFKHTNGKTYSAKQTGNRFNVRGYSRKQNIPKRQFIGNSNELHEIILNTLNKEIGKLFQEHK